VARSRSPAADRHTARDGPRYYPSRTFTHARAPPSERARRARSERAPIARASAPGRPTRSPVRPSSTMSTIPAPRGDDRPVRHRFEQDDRRPSVSLLVQGRRKNEARRSPIGGHQLPVVTRPRKSTRSEIQDRRATSGPFGSETHDSSRQGTRRSRPGPEQPVFPFRATSRPTNRMRGLADSRLDRIARVPPLAPPREAGRRRGSPGSAAPPRRTRSSPACSPRSRPARSARSTSAGTDARAGIVSRPSGSRRHRRSSRARRPRPGRPPIPPAVGTAQWT
jgi:hypothetical protein